MVAGVCIHCGTPLPPGSTDEFCCNGCRAAWRLIHEGGLAEFYRMRQAAGDPAGVPAQEEPAAAAFDGEAFRAAWCERLPDGNEAIRWYVEGLHCPACVWLVERLPVLLPGIRSARLDLGAALLRVVFDPARTGPGAQARLLAGLGYRVRPWRSDAVAQALRQEHRGLLLRAVVAGACAVGAMHLAATLTAGELTGDLDPAVRPIFAWAALLASLPACLWSALPLHRAAWAQLRARRWGVDLAASLVIAIALAASSVAAWRGSQVSYADAAAMFVALLLTARLAVVAARMRISRAAGGLVHLLPATAHLADGAAVALEALRPGDQVAVEVGGVVPCDGVASTSAAVDAAILTGEPRPVAVAAGDSVLAGTRCSAGPLRLTVTVAGSDTRLGQLLAAAAPRSGISAGDDAAARAVAWFAPATLAIAVLAGGAWWWHGGAGAGIAVAVAVLMAACPCAIGLAAPLVQALAAASASSKGLLLRDPAALAMFPRLRSVVIDKTGTLTEGRMRVVSIQAHGDWLPAGVLAVEERSRHPAALALVEHLRGDMGGSFQPKECSVWQELPASGVTGLVDGRTIRVGGAAWTGCSAPPAGCSRIGVAVDGVLLAEIDLADPLRADARALVDSWQAAGLQVHLASGDHPAAVAACARELGLPGDRAHGGMTPESKAALVRSLREQGAVAALGDGVNDAAALAAADLAVGLRGGLQAALDRCHVFCAYPEQAGPTQLWALAQRARRQVRTLLWISAGYNVVAVAGAAAGWFGPLVCAVAMPASSLTVIALAVLWAREPGSPGPGR